MQSARNTTAFRSIFDAGELKSELENSGVKPSMIPYVWKQVIQNPDAQFDQIPSLPSAAYPLLTSKFKTLTSSVHKNGALVEAVIMRYDSRLGKYDGKPRPGGPRSTLCVSSQIVEQLVHASRISPIRNIVFMGMGEPLNNYGSLVEAIHVMTGSPFHLSPKKITVSTVGIIHAIKKLHSDLPGLNLAVSLHAPVQEIRCLIMPAARAFPLVKLMDTLQEYQNNTQQKIFIEYIMLDGVNDEEQHAHQLGKLLETFQVVINLIPFNPIGILSKFSTSNENKVTSFQNILRGTYGIRTTVRKEMGQDISGACGQLVVNLPNKRSTENTQTDIEDLQVR
ncbi:hypothetical protein C1H46_016160 [Malus baccata]|uniref:Radical SAM core domain-containing protein n=1 Tax=Malus baccata TaxID=106549 RepID=A0A540MHH8_MALBA|nr:hypothetical protein C1H46_016160 [Malus baccata]